MRTLAADASSFTNQLPYYVKNPQLFEDRLSIEAIQQVLTNAQEKYFVPNRADGKPWVLRLGLSRQPLKAVSGEPGQ